MTEPTESTSEKTQKTSNSEAETPVTAEPLQILFYGHGLSGVRQRMYQGTSIHELELLELKITSRRHIIYGVLLTLIIPCVLFLFFYTIGGSFVLFIIITPGLGLWFIYDGITGYKKYKRLKKETDQSSTFT